MIFQWMNEWNEKENRITIKKRKLSGEKSDEKIFSECFEIKSNLCFSLKNKVETILKVTWYLKV